MRSCVMSTSTLEPPPLGDTARVRRALLHAAGGYLCNVIREPKITCRVCAGPVDGFERCWRCEQARRIAGVADVVAPLTYAIAGTPSAALVRDYKNHPVRKMRESRSALINWLVGLGITRHERCIGAAAGSPISLRVVIPSLTSWPGVHPLAEIARTLGVLGEVRLVATPTALCDGVVRADKFMLTPGSGVEGRHVLVLDDMWTTGSNAQSAALALRRDGAAAVSVMVVCRWLNPSYGRTGEFVKTRLQRDYDPDICPVTGASCP
jgi:hypothetical protein